MRALPVIIERRSPAHRAFQLVGLIAVIAFFLFVVSVVENFSAIRWAVAVTLSVGILGLNIVTGYSGQISIGHSAFFGIGAYTTMILIADHGWPFLATLPVAGALGFLVGAVIGIPALRIRGLYLSLITLGLALAFPAVVKSDNFFGIDFASLTGGSNGKVISSGDVTTTRGFHWNPPSWAPDGWTTNDWVFATVFVIALIMFVLTSNLVRSSVGRGLVAMRDNETGAAVSGVYPAQYKVLAFASSAFVTAIGGGCFALAATTIGPDTFGLQRSIEFIAGLVIGGVATILGPAIGGVLVEWLPYWAFEVDWPVFGKLEGPQAGVLYGAILVVIIFFMPGGVVYGLRQLRAKVLIFVPRLPAPRQISSMPLVEGERAEGVTGPPEVVTASVQQTARESNQ
ncbi:MAG TPA: branched-chain amino acid ABC transporter permease [Ilumatobacteraceae bacterium]|jgi:branched-chain amino acid transport system permease protein